MDAFKREQGHGSFSDDPGSSEPESGKGNEIAEEEKADSGGGGYESSPESEASEEEVVKRKKNPLSKVGA